MDTGHDHHVHRLEYYADDNLKGTLEEQRFPLPSAGLLAVADALVRRHLSSSCGAPGRRPRSHGAMLRIAYGGGGDVIKRSVEAFGASCHALLERLERFARSVTSAHASAVDGGGCRPAGFLATDWFVSADAFTSPAYRKALEDCWDARMGAPSASAWFWIQDERQLRPLVRAHAPQMLERPRFYDAAGRLVVRESAYSTHPASMFRAMLELAVVVTVDDCFIQGHMGLIAEQMRRRMGGKSRCVIG